MRPFGTALFAATSALLLSVCIPSLARPLPATPRPRAARLMLARLPLAFEPVAFGRGFAARGPGYALSVDGRTARLALRRGKTAVVPVTMTLAGAARPAGAGERPLPGRVNYFLGRDQKKWRTNVPTYGAARFAGVYPGTDVVYYGKNGTLEYDFRLAPGADPNRIALRFGGVRHVAVEKSGALTLRLAGGAVRWARPVAYQSVGGRRVLVAGRFASRADGTVGFALGKYNPALPLTIDPALIYSTFLGTAIKGNSVTSDSAGNVYVGAFASPGSVGGAGMSLGGSNNGEASVLKFSPSGTLLYATYVGGNNTDYINGIAVDLTGAIYATGYTFSTNFPVTAGAVGASGPIAQSESSAFVYKIAPGGASLVYSAILGTGATGGTEGYSIAVDAAGSAYVAGFSSEPTFPTTPSAVQPTINNPNTNTLSGVFSRLSAAGDALLYSTFLPGTGSSTARGVAVDGSVTAGGVAVITGNTFATDFPVTPTAVQGRVIGSSSAFVLSLDTTKNGLSSVRYSTLFGSQSQGAAVAVDPANGQIYLCGVTGQNLASANGYTGTHAADSGRSDLFLTRLDPSQGNAAGILYSTLLGGIGDDTAVSSGIGVIGSGVVVIGGTSNSGNFPIVGGGLSGQSTYHDAGQPTGFPSDGVFAEFDTNQTGAASLLFSSYLGGTGSDVTIGIAADVTGKVYLTGYTSSYTDFPTTPNAFQQHSTLTTGQQAFLSIVTFGSAVSSVTFSQQGEDVIGVCGGETVTVTVTLSAPAPAGGATVTLVSSNPAVVTLPATVTVAAGQSTGSVDITAHPVAADTTVMVTASYGGGAATGTVVVGAPLLSELDLDGQNTDLSVTAGSTVTGTVVLSCPALPGPKNVRLTYSGPAATGPARVTVPAGASSATFPITTSSVTAATPVTVTATDSVDGTQVQSHVLTVVPNGVVGLVVNPAAVSGGSGSVGTLSLNGPAPAGGITVSLTSSDPSATVPATVTVPAGASSVTFPITTTPVSAQIVVTISATYNGVTVQAALTVQTLSVTSLTLDPASVLAGAGSVGTVSISSVAGTGGLSVMLKSDSAAAGVPATVLIPAGASSATFPVTTVALSAATTVANITASLNGTAKTAALTVQPLLVSSLTLAPTPVAGGATLVGTVTLSGVAPAGGARVVLSSTDLSVPVPAQVTVPAGQTTVSFVLFTRPVAATVTVTVSAVYGATAPKTAAVTVTGSTLTSVSVAPSSVTGGNGALGTITLTGQAPAGGLRVTLRASDPSVTVPASVLVPAGAMTVTFPVTTSRVTQSVSAAISATLGATQASTALSVTAISGGGYKAGLSFFSLPYDYSGVSLDTLFGFAGVKLATYVTPLAAYAVTPTAPADAVRLGRGYWARFPAAGTVTQEGTPADTTQDFAIPLDTGWNNIGDPFTGSVGVSALQVKAGARTVTFADAVSNAYLFVSPTLYRYDGTQYQPVTASDALQVGSGYWIYAYSPVSLIVPHGSVLPPVPLLAHSGTRSSGARRK